MREIDHPSLSDLTTLGLGGHARKLFVLESPKECETVEERLLSLEARPYVLGAGSNILAYDGELPLVLIRLSFQEEPAILGKMGEETLVSCPASYGLPKFLRFCAEHGLSGLEGLSGIPGSVGGAIAMNAGSFGSETCAHLFEVTLWADKRCVTLQRGEFSFGYRHFSVLSGTKNFILLSAIFLLTHGEKNDIFSRMNLNFLKKKSKQPLNERSAGCVFKNPPDAPSAGALLEEAGFRGKMHGKVGFSSVHANFLINRGGSAECAMELLTEAEERVFASTGIRLEKEVKIIPCP